MSASFADLPSRRGCRSRCGSRASCGSPPKAGAWLDVHQFPRACDHARVRHCLWRVRRHDRQVRLLSMPQLLTSSAGVPPELADLRHGAAATVFVLERVVKLSSNLDDVLLQQVLSHLLQGSSCTKPCNYQPGACCPCACYCADVLPHQPPVPHCWYVCDLPAHMRLVLGSGAVKSARRSCTIFNIWVVLCWASDLKHICLMCRPDADHHGEFDLPNGLICCSSETVSPLVCHAAGIQADWVVHSGGSASPSNYLLCSTRGEGILVAMQSLLMKPRCV